MPKKDNKAKSSNNNNDDVKGLMMILSPAKTLDLSPFEAIESLPPTHPDCSPDLTRTVARAMKGRNESELVKLLGISANLAKAARKHWQDYCEDENQRSLSERKPCVFMFSGAAYQGLDIKKRSETSISYMQQNLRIIDPLYGALRPLDRIQPYRLEMATKGVFSTGNDDSEKKKKKLVDFWSESVSRSLTETLSKRDDPVLLNLASDEYSAAVDESLLPKTTRYIKIVFWEDGRVISVSAKRARGLMVKYISERGVHSIDDVKSFTEEGYEFQEDKSDETTLVFNRRKSNKRSPVPSRAVSSKQPKKS